MTEFVSGVGDEMAFFKGRQWLPRGVRYPVEETDLTAADEAEEVLATAANEVELAFHESRLRGAVASAIAAVQNGAAPVGDGDAGTAVRGSTDSSQEDGNAAEVRTAAAALQSSVAGDVIAAVDTLCGFAAGVEEEVGGGGVSGSAGADAARDALDALIGFTGSGEGPLAARRAAVAFVGGAGGAAGGAGLEAVAAVFRGDKSPGVRRTAGDALRCFVEFKFVRRNVIRAGGDLEGEQRILIVPRVRVNCQDLVCWRVSSRP